MQNRSSDSEKCRRSSLSNVLLTSGTTVVWSLSAVRHKPVAGRGNGAVFQCSRARSDGCPGGGGRAMWDGAQAGCPSTLGDQSTAVPVSPPDPRSGTLRPMAAGPTRIVEHLACLGHVGDAVLQLDEDVGAMIEAKTVAGAEVLVDPHAHGGRNGTPLCLHWLGRD